MAMMPPAIVVTAVPTVVMAATAVMAPPMPMPVPVPALYRNNRLIGSAHRRGCCYGHSRRRHSWRKCKGTAGKSDYQKPFHLAPSPSWQMLLWQVLLRIISSVFEYSLGHLFLLR